MRTLKFRAWDKLKGEWLFSYKELGGFDILGEVILLGEFAEVPLESLGELEIMQYTGRKDRYGVEIYENDILSDGAVVQYFNDLGWEGNGSEHPGFYCKKWLAGSDMDYYNDFDEVIVVGNVHENPELLK